MTMRVMVLVKATDAREQGLFDCDWSAEMIVAMGRFYNELEAAGVLIMASAA